MNEHKCSFKAFLRVIESLHLTKRVRDKIKAFGHFLDFKGGLVVDSSLLDNDCGCWEVGCEFSSGPATRTRLHMSPYELGSILNIPKIGRRMDLGSDDYQSIFYRNHLHNFIMNRYHYNF